MAQHSKFESKAPAESDDHDRRVAEFFSGGSMSRQELHRDHDAGPTIASIQERDLSAAVSALDDLDDLDDDTPATFITAHFHFSDDDYNDRDVERIDATPNPACRYGKAFAKVRAIEAQLEDAGPDDAPRITADLREANAAWDVEKARAVDDRYRKFHRVDLWRAGEGRDEYNATRRKRDLPNDHTPKEVLGAMTPDERTQHDADMVAKRKWKSDRRKAGWAEDQIEAGLQGWWDKRELRRRERLPTATPYSDVSGFGDF
jgi:hypothetical protein